MNIFIYILLLAFLIFLSVQNFGKIKQNQNDSQYMESYRKVITRSEDALEFMDKYLSKETIPSFITKTNVIKLAELMEKEMDYSSTLESIDLKSLFVSDKGFSVEYYNGNSDVFLWIVLVMAKANRLGKKDLIENLYIQLKEVEPLEGYMEYQLVKAYYNVFNGNKDFTFVNDLLNGEYGNYRYNRHVIGLDKRFTESLKASVGEELDELSLADIPEFAKTYMGEYLMSDLGIYEQYAVKEEPTEYLDDLNEEEENKEEEN